ncbi:glycoside hydrolase family 30 protein [Pseudoxanthomonas koreensis]|uniref:glycoside hydrolase family 30 protein n=1 Tax=Pseudoxanthomonas koreensis TaxID=266061 RepID=UPI0013917D0F|nr:glycoside hydrolase family 30 beta sandwich domain-containing protein [Pseudoxanthomonas koreensis]KAF1692126.1 glycosyl hydrolase [Pseudoxanthomonas koreensis]
MKWLRLPEPARIGLAVLLASLPGLAGASATGQVQAWVTTSDHRLALAPVGPAELVAGTPEAGGVRIVVEPRQRHQSMVGFGASLTDASAWLIRHRLDEAQRDALLRELFGREDGGLGLGFTRLTIGASDFSRHHYSLDDPPDGRPDPELRHFSLEPNRDDVIPVARAMLAINPQLKIMASPWSAPAWMKDNGSLVQGRLLPQYYDAFSRYLLRYVDAMAAEGVPVFALTVQNEPDFEPGDYPGMRLNAAQRARLVGDHLGPMIEARGGTPLLFDWDHNWDKPEEPLAVLRDPAAGRHIDAVAWHCYGGDPSAQAPVHAAFPDRDVYMTECSGGDWEPLRSGGLALQTRSALIGSVRNGARGVLFWNLALDENNGPHAGGCDTCRGVVTIDSRTGAVTRTDEYYALAHASRFVRPGAYRIESSGRTGGLDNVAFRNDDGSLVLLVSNDAPGEQAFEVVQDGHAFRASLPGRSIGTWVWTPPAHDAD